MRNSQERYNRSDREHRPAYGRSNDDYSSHEDFRDIGSGMSSADRDLDRDQYRTSGRDMDRQYSDRVGRVDRDSERSSVRSDRMAADRNRSMDRSIDYTNNRIYSSDRGYSSASHPQSSSHFDRDDIYGANSYSGRGDLNSSSDLSGRRPEFGTGRSSYGSSSDRNERSDRYGASSSTSSFVGKGPKGYKRSDDRIKEDVSEALYQHYEIDASEIEIAVKDGEVILTGTVNNRYMKRMAEDVIERVSGVTEVTNQIRVQKSDESSDSKLSSSKSSSTSSLNSSTSASAAAKRGSSPSSLS